MSVIAVCCGKGSPGATFTSINLAWALSAAGEEVLIADLDPHGGDLAAYLGLDPSRGLYPLVHLEGTVTSLEALTREAESKSGMSCIAGHPLPDHLAQESMSEVMKALLLSDAHVIADVGRVEPPTADCLHLADLVIVVMRTDLVSIFGAERVIELMSRAAVERSKIAALVTGCRRYGSSVLDEIEDALRVPVLGAIPMDRRKVQKAFKKQDFLRKGRAAKAFRMVASRLIASPDDEPEGVGQAQW